MTTRLLGIRKIFSEYADDVAVVVAGNCVTLWSYYMCVARTSFLWSMLGFLLTMVVC